MTAKIISIANQKGGVGKTTLTMQIAGTLGRRGKKVLVVDADPQGTAVRWSSSGEGESARFPAHVVSLEKAGKRVHQEVGKFKDDYDFILIDCPPAADSEVPQSAFLISDMVLVPIIPSPPDLWAAIGIKKTIANISHINESLIARLVINQNPGNTTMAKEVLDILPDFGIEMMKSKLCTRTVYRESAGMGQTVHFFGNRAKPAIDELEDLTNEIIDILFLKNGDEQEKF